MRSSSRQMWLRLSIGTDRAEFRASGTDCLFLASSHLWQFLRVEQKLSPGGPDDYIWLERYPPVLAPPTLQPSISLTQRFP